MKKSWLSAIAGIAAISLAGCSGAGINNQDIGTIAGGALGGVLGNQIGGGSGRIIATIGGTLLGAYLGNQIGHSMDMTDQMMMQQSLNSGQPQSWTNQHTGDQYRVVPGARQGNCRKYTMYAYIDGQKRPVRGTACNNNGQWVATNS